MSVQGQRSRGGWGALPPTFCEDVILFRFSMRYVRRNKEEEKENKKKVRLATDYPPR